MHTISTAHKAKSQQLSAQVKSHIAAGKSYRVVDAGVSGYDAADSNDHKKRSRRDLNFKKTKTGDDK